MADSDELVSQFLAFTGSADTDRAVSYLEMSGGNVETAVGLYMEHHGGGIGGAGGGGAAGADGGLGPGLGSPEVRAPDATRTMRLMDDGGGHGHHGYMQHHMDAMMEEQIIQASAFGAPRFLSDARDLVNAAASATAVGNSASSAAAESKENSMDDEEDDNSIPRAPSSGNGNSNLARLADMFAPPDHLIFKEGGFEGARNMAKDNKRWLLVNLQRDSEFSCHALNRDVWRDELVENLIREGFIFWQAMDLSAEGRVYAQRYHVHDYPHIGIIDPRTRRLMYKKEGWTQEKPLTAELFAETAMDFCSRHSFDKPPVAPRPVSASSLPSKRAMHEMSEDEQLQAAMRASLGDDDEDDVIVMDDDEEEGDEVEYLAINDGEGEDMKPEAAPVQPEEKPSSLIDELVGMSLGDEPANGARIQLRMPDGKRFVRKFDSSASVKTIYAFVAQSNEEAKGGKEFVLMAGFPPKDLITDIGNTIESCQLSGQAITVRWK